MKNENIKYQIKKINDIKNKVNRIKNNRRNRRKGYDYINYYDVVMEPWFSNAQLSYAFTSETFPIEDPINDLSIKSVYEKCSGLIISDKRKEKIKYIINNLRK